MGYLFFLVWLLLAMPGLPISIPVIHYTFKDARGGSGALGAACVISAAIGGIIWLLIGAFWLGHILLK